MPAASWRFWGRLASTGPTSLVAAPHYRTGNPTVLWVDSLNGDDAKTGKNKEEPKKTIESALSVAVNGTLIGLMSGFTQTVAALLTVAKTGIRIVGEGSGNQQAKLLTGDVNGLITTTGGLDLENIRFPAAAVQMADNRLSVTTGGRLRIIDCLLEAGTTDFFALVYNLSSSLVTKGSTFRVTSGHPLQAVGMNAGFSEIDSCLIDGGVFGWRDDGAGRQVAVEVVQGWLDMHDTLLRNHSDVYVHVDTANTIAQVRFAKASDLGEDCSILFETELEA